MARDVTFIRRTRAALLVLFILHVAVTGALGLEDGRALGDGNQRVSRHVSLEAILLPPPLAPIRAPEPVQPVRSLRALQRTRLIPRQQATLVAVADGGDPQVHGLARRQIKLPLRLCATGEDDSPSSITLPSLG